MKYLLKLTRVGCSVVSDAAIAGDTSTIVGEKDDDYVDRRVFAK